ncbi:unnamed protein product, partial [Polarella glacialis]
HNLHCKCSLAVLLVTLLRYVLIGEPVQSFTHVTQRPQLVVAGGRVNRVMMAATASSLESAYLRPDPTEQEGLSEAVGSLTSYVGSVHRRAEQEKKKLFEQKQIVAAYNIYEHVLRTGLTAGHITFSVVGQVSAGYAKGEHDIVDQDLFDMLHQNNKVVRSKLEDLCGEVGFVSTFTRAERLKDWCERSAMTIPVPSVDLSFTMKTRCPSP